MSNDSATSLSRDITPESAAGHYAPSLSRDAILGITGTRDPIPESHSKYIPFFEKVKLPLAQRPEKRARKDIEDPPNTAGALSTVPSDNTNHIQRQANQCQKLVEDLIESTISDHEFFRELRSIGVTSDQAQDFTQQAQERIAIRRGKKRQTGAPTPDLVHSSPAPIDDEAVGVCSQTLQANDQQASQDNQGWNELEERISFANQCHGSPSLMDKFIELFDNGRSRSHHSGIPDSVISIAPHLMRHATAAEPEDPHIKRPRELKRAFSSDRALEALLNFAKAQSVKDPVSQGIWKLIILDQFVNFTKLYATFNPSYDHNDNPRDFGHDFVLIKKDQINQRRTIASQSDWSRCFDAWAEGVVLFYPHRQDELRVYREEVIDIFRQGFHSVSVAIDFDIDAHNCYANQPFCLNDVVKLQKMYTDQVIKSSQASRPTFSSYPNFTPKKKPTTICQN
ncbi:hypothetical protein C0991_002306 [Blastosporella zonata]|nr:hypothetical protein C0991_002306 [Blastosporella zonata]